MYMYDIILDCLLCLRHKETVSNPEPRKDIFRSGNSKTMTSMTSMTSMTTRSSRSSRSSSSSFSTWSQVSNVPGTLIRTDQNENIKGYFNLIIFPIDSGNFDCQQDYNFRISDCSTSISVAGCRWFLIDFRFSGHFSRHFRLPKYPAPPPP